MTPADEAYFIALWNAGTESAAIGRQLGIPRGTVAWCAHTLVHQGKIQPRPRGGTYPSQRARARQEGPPSTVHLETWELKQLKHSIRWTVCVP